LLISKYRPSLDALLPYLGIIVVMLFLLQKFRGLSVLHGFLAIFAQVPMFIYMYHIAVGALIAWICFLVGLPSLSVAATALLALVFMVISIPVFKWYYRFTSTPGFLSEVQMMSFHVLEGDASEECSRDVS